MDTTLSCKTKKFIAFFLSTVSVIGILFSQNINLFAEELKLAHSVIVSPVLDNVKTKENISREAQLQALIKNFDEDIHSKYKQIGYNVKISQPDVGVYHIKATRTYQGRPVRLNIIEVDKSLNPEIKIKPTLASNTLANKSTIKRIASKNNTLVAINGTYFKPQTGVPLGTLMIDGKLFTGPIYDRVAIGFFNDKYEMARIQFSGELQHDKEKIKIDNFNQPRMLSSYVLAYDKHWGKYAPKSPKNGLQIAVEKGKIIDISENTLAIPENGFVIVAPFDKLKNLELGDKVKIKIGLLPEWENVEHIVSGGPYLVKNGEVFVDISAQKLKAIGGRNPRTAIGYTYDNRLILITADGREGNSIGLTLFELAYLMKNLGCVYAMNLDGGGSTVMYVNGAIANKPQVTGGIALSNALTIIK